MKIRLTILFLAVASIAFAQKKEIKKIEKAIAQNDYKKATEIFKTIDPNSVEEKYKADYLFYKAASLTNPTGNEMPSVSDFNKADIALKESIKMGFKNQNYIQFMTSIINEGRFALAQKLLKEEKTDEALGVVKDLYKANPDNLEMLYNAATLAYQAQKFEIATADYEALLEKGYTGQRTTYYGIDDKGSKVPMSKSAIEIGIQTGQFKSMEMDTSSSRIGEIVTNLTWMYVQNGSIDKGKKLMATMLNKYPSDSSLVDASSNIYLQLGMMDEYKIAMDKLLNGRKDPTVFQNLANAALNAGNYEEAITFYDKSLELQGDNLAALNNAANAFIQVANNLTFDKDKVTGNYREAVEAFNDNRKNTYMKALNYLEKALKLDPTNVNVAQNLLPLYGYFKMEDKQKALEARFQ